MLVGDISQRDWLRWQASEVGLLVSASGWGGLMASLLVTSSNPSRTGLLYCLGIAAADAILPGATILNFWAAFAVSTRIHKHAQSIGHCIVSCRCRYLKVVGTTRPISEACKWLYLDRFSSDAEWFLSGCLAAVCLCVALQSLTGSGFLAGLFGAVQSAMVMQMVPDHLVRTQAIIQKIYDRTFFV